MVAARKNWRRDQDDGAESRLSEFSEGEEMVLSFMG